MAIEVLCIIDSVGGCALGVAIFLIFCRDAESLHDQVCTFCAGRGNLSFRVNPRKERKSIANFSKIRIILSNGFKAVLERYS